MLCMGEGQLLHSDTAVTAGSVHKAGAFPRPLLQLCPSRVAGVWLNCMSPQGPARYVMMLLSWRALLSPAARLLSNGLKECVLELAGELGRRPARLSVGVCAVQTCSCSQEFPPPWSAVGSAGWDRRTENPASWDLPVSHSRSVQGLEWVESSLQEEIQEGERWVFSSCY